MCALYEQNQSLLGELAAVMRADPQSRWRDAKKELLRALETYYKTVRTRIRSQLDSKAKAFEKRRSQLNSWRKRVYTGPACAQRIPERAEAGRAEAHRVAALCDSVCLRMRDVLCRCSSGE